MRLVNKIPHRWSAARPGPDAPARLFRARVALCAVFAAHGFIFASWAVRVPAVKEQTGASSAVLGLALLGLSAGAVATMALAGGLCRRLGSQRLAVVSCALLSVTLVLPALARSATMLGYSGFPLGPPAIGFLASEFGLRAGLTTLSFLALAAAAIAYHQRSL